MEEFQPDEIAFVSMGTLTWIKPAIKSLRMRGIESGLLQMEMENAAGKMSYPMAIKKMFTWLWMLLLIGMIKSFSIFVWKIENPYTGSAIAMIPTKTLKKPAFDALFGNQLTMAYRSRHAKDEPELKLCPNLLMGAPTCRSLWDKEKERLHRLLRWNY